MSTFLRIEGWLEHEISHKNKQFDVIAVLDPYIHYYYKCLGIVVYLSSGGVCKPRENWILVKGGDSGQTK